ncbi:MAG: hypothetical protein H6741_30215 [Alphaproteobacteria bacterium]|nr:hypothetical protein [Alphaproteobacteria bacterium]
MNGPQLFLAAGPEGAPALPEGLQDEELPEITQPLRSSYLLDDPGADRSDLAAQRWAVIAPEGDRGDALLEAIAPLIERRAQDMGCAVEQVLTRRVAPDLDGIDASNWVSEELADVPPDQQPAYLLLLGDLHEISAAFQIHQPAKLMVGRLCFDALSDYTAYAQRLAEAAPRGDAAPIHLHATLDGSKPCEVGAAHLITPLHEALTAAAPGGLTPITTGLTDPEAGAIPALLANSRGAVVLTNSHGEGVSDKNPDGLEGQRALTGMLQLEDKSLLQAAALRDAAVVQDGLWVAYACFSAGVPGDSDTWHWFKDLHGAAAAKRLNSFRPVGGGPGFIGALPKLALANPRGPRALIAHLDFAWELGFRDWAFGEPRKAISSFQQLLSGVARGQRVGSAFSTLRNEVAQVEKNLMVDINREAKAKGDGKPYTVNAKRRGYLWLRRQDLSGFVLMGDPAAQL